MSIYKSHHQLRDQKWNRRFVCGPLVWEKKGGKTSKLRHDYRLTMESSQRNNAASEQTRKRGESLVWHGNFVFFKVLFMSVFRPGTTTLLCCDYFAKEAKFDLKIRLWSANEVTGLGFRSKVIRAARLCREYQNATDWIYDSSWETYLWKLLKYYWRRKRALFETSFALRSTFWLK